MKATREAYGEALLELGRSNDKVVALDADLSKSTKTSLFAKEFPERFFNVGIAEQNLIGVAAGLSLAGFVPYASTFAIFATGRAWEQIRNTVAYPSLNVKICASHAGITVGEDGASHQSIEDIALMSVIPNMTVLVPADSIETKSMVNWAYQYNGPVYIRLGRMGVPDILSKNYNFDTKPFVLKKGKRIVIFATGIMLWKCLEAIELLKPYNVEPTLVNVSCIKPFPEESIIEIAKEHEIVFTAEEHNVINGLGSMISSTLSRNYPMKVYFIGIDDRFGTSGKPNDLLSYYGLDANSIKEKLLLLGLK
ncbi:MAG TPA: transketolase family protein [Thermodesulfobium narugense]|nr:MAG: transketolase [Thermodesulfobium narugense]HEM56427.1 transketolase family protein [Thermodesulfobium narugense]